MKKIPLACQLYSVHKSLAQDFEGTVRKVAQAGYTGVEFFGGLAAYSPERINAAMQENGLTICGWHSAITDFAPENIKETIAFHKAIGNSCMVVPGLPAEMTSSAAAWHATAARFREIGAVLAQEGMRTGYHNHFTEFALLDGEVPWDILAQETDAEFVLQIDNGNAMMGGADPMIFLKKYPGRAYTFHFKPYDFEKGFDVVPGEDSVPYAQTVDELIRQNATKWIIAEYETEKLFSDVDGVKVFYDNFSKVLDA